MTAGPCSAAGSYFDAVPEHFGWFVEVVVVGFPVE